MYEGGGGGGKGRGARGVKPLGPRRMGTSSNAQSSARGRVSNIGGAGATRRRRRQNCREVDICGKPGGSVDMVIHMALRIFSTREGKRGDRESVSGQERGTCSNTESDQSSHLPSPMVQ